MRLAIALCFSSLLALAAPKDVAAVELVVFVDLEDPFSARLSSTIEELRKKYGSRLTVRFMHFPLGHHKYARVAALSAEAARRQGRFDAMVSYLLVRHQALPLAQMRWFAEGLGLDVARFEADGKDPALAAEVDRQRAIGVAVGVTTTPMSFVNGVPIAGAQPAAALEKLVDAEAAAAGKSRGPRHRAERLAKNHLPLYAQLYGDGKLARCSTVEACRQACDRRDGTACGDHARLLEEQKAEPPVVYAAYLRACDARHGDACFNVAGRLERGEGIEKNGDLAVEKYELACFLGVGEACALAGPQLRQRQQPDRANSAFERGCEIKEARSCLEIAVVWDRLNRGPEEHKAVDAYRVACDAGIGLACNELGWILGGGGVGAANGGVAVDQPKTVPLFTKACDAHNGAGCANLAWRYENGVVVAKDAARAVDLYHRGCVLKQDWSCQQACRLGRKDVCPNAQPLDPYAK